MSAANHDFQTWESLLVTLSSKPELPLTAVERGMVFSLVANRPTVISDSQLTILTELKAKYGNLTVPEERPIASPTPPTQEEMIQSLEEETRQENLRLQ